MNHFHNWKLINSEELGIIAVCDCGSQVKGQKEIEILLSSTLHYGTLDLTGYVLKKKAGLLNSMLGFTKDDDYDHRNEIPS